MTPDWQLPPGVSRGLWEYLHDPAIARRYDEQLAGTPLLRLDLEFFLEHCSIAGRCIDLGCGTGRLALTLAAKQYQVTAVDLSAEMLRVLGEKAARAGVRIDCVQANLVELEGIASESFDYAACLFGTLGMIQSAESRGRFLAHVRRLLRPGGVFVVHVHNRWIHLGTRAGRRLLLQQWWDRLRGRCAAGDFWMPPHSGLGSMPMHLFTLSEIKAALRASGMQVIKIQPVSARAGGRLRAPWCLSRLRAFGYLVAARAPLTASAGRG